MGFMIWTVVGRDRWARRVGFGGPSGPALPPIAMDSARRLIRSHSSLSFFFLWLGVRKITRKKNEERGGGTVPPEMDIDISTTPRSATGVEATRS